MDSMFEQIMQDSSIRKTFGERVKQLRKEKGWTQKKPGNKIGVTYAQAATIMLDPHGADRVR